MRKEESYILSFIQFSFVDSEEMSEPCGAGEGVTSGSGDNWRKRIITLLSFRAAGPVRPEGDTTGYPTYEWILWYENSKKD